MPSFAIRHFRAKSVCSSVLTVNTSCQHTNAPQRDIADEPIQFARLIGIAKPFLCGSDQTTRRIGIASGNQHVVLQARILRSKRADELRSCAAATNRVDAN
jgi:hypothetical protein